jgi:GNAT superfamily N-acetyltransferase
MVRAPMSSFSFRRPEDPAELTRFGALAAHSLGFPPERAAPFLARVGAANVRLAYCHADLAGGLVILPMGHWFGGRSVPCHGISLVAVAPEYRSQGIASFLLRAVLEEARRDRVALASLYPATCPVYRAVGFETSGNRTVYRLTLALLGEGARAPAMREAKGASDVADMCALYDARARTLTGRRPGKSSSAMLSHVRRPRHGASCASSSITARSRAPQRSAPVRGIRCCSSPVRSGSRSPRPSGG